MIIHLFLEVLVEVLNYHKSLRSFLFFSFIFLFCWNVMLLIRKKLTVFFKFGLWLLELQFSNIVWVFRIEFCVILLSFRSSLDFTIWMLWHFFLFFNFFHYNILSVLLCLDFNPFVIVLNIRLNFRSNHFFVLFLIVFLSEF